MTIVPGKMYLAYKVHAKNMYYYIQLHQAKCGPKMHHGIS